MGVKLRHGADVGFIDSLWAATPVCSQPGPSERSVLAEAAGNLESRHPMHLGMLMGMQLQDHFWTSPARLVVAVQVLPWEIFPSVSVGNMSFNIEPFCTQELPIMIILPVSLPGNLFCDMDGIFIFMGYVRCPLALFLTIMLHGRNCPCY